MLSKLWRRLRASRDEYQRQRDEVATEEFLREHEEHERAKGEPADLPPGRNNTDWTYVPPG